MQEEFRDVEGYEGLYQISNLGNIKSLSKFVSKGFCNFTTKEKILIQSINKNGYHSVKLCKNKIKKTFNIHQLVAITFLNHKPKYDNLIIDHINNNKSDNRVLNLQLISQRLNTSKDKENKTSKYTGVSFAKTRNNWISQIYINGKSIVLGRFTSELEASNAYQNKLKELNEL